MRDVEIPDSNVEQRLFLDEARTTLDDLETEIARITQLSRGQEKVAMGTLNALNGDDEALDPTSQTSKFPTQIVLQQILDSVNDYQSTELFHLKDKIVENFNLLSAADVELSNSQTRLEEAEAALSTYFEVIQEMAENTSLDDIVHLYRLRIAVKRATVDNLNVRCTFVTQVCILAFNISFLCENCPSVEQDGTWSMGTSKRI